MTYLEKLPEKRRERVEMAARGSLKGTDELLAAVIADAGAPACWRPATAAVEAVIAAQSGGVHMTSDDFMTWKKQARAVARVRGLDIKTYLHIGMSKYRYNDLGNARRVEERGLIFSKVEALACAHFLMGFDLPCEPDGLKEWFWPRLGQMSAVARFLEMSPDALSGWINGYVIRDGVRTPMAPSLADLRALDWTWRCGPFNPYGQYQKPAYTSERAPT